MSVSSSKFEVFFDGECPLCRREIDMIRRKDKRDVLLLTDISAQGFELEGFTQSELMKEIHGRKADGSFVKGVEVFRQIYRRLGFERTVRATRFPLIKHVLNFGYWIFAKLRYAHAMHRAKRQAKIGCDSNSCPTDERPLSKAEQPSAGSKASH